MNTEINLAIKKHKENRFVSAKKVKKFRLVATIFLFSVAILSASLFFVIAASPIPSLRKQEESTSVELTKLQPEFGKYLLVRSQLQDVKGLLTMRPDLRIKIDTVLSMIPGGVSVTNISLDEKTVAMALTTSSLDALSKLFSLIEDKAISGAVPTTITTSPIAYSAQTQQYILQISFK